MLNNQIQNFHISDNMKKKKKLNEEEIYEEIQVIDILVELEWLSF
jgi:hypothetical protein